MQIQNSEKPLAGVSILLVEDGEENRQIINYLMHLCGATVRNAENGLIGLDMMTNPKNTFDLVLMDIRMPYMDGYTTTSRAKAAGFKPPIIALTANTRAEDQAKCTSIGFDDYLTKPVNIPLLVKTIAKHIKKELKHTSMQNSQDKTKNTPQPSEDGVILSVYHDQPMYHGLIMEFANNLNQRISEFQQVAESQDAAKTNALAHKIKGAAATYGFPQLSEEAEKIEALTANGQWDQSAVNQEIEKLAAICKAVQRGAASLARQQQQTH